VGERAVIEHLDAYTAPRLVEYFDENPCRPRMLMAPRASALPLSRRHMVVPRERRHASTV